MSRPIDGPRPRPTTFVTVVFEAELRLLALQFRSFARFAPDGAVHSVILIDNTARGLDDAMLADLRREAGGFADRLRVVRPRDLTRVRRGTGWHFQQVLKLLVARLVETPDYVVLDAKNHFVAPLDDGYFFAPDGRPRCTAHPYVEHVLRPDLRAALAYMDVPVEHERHFPGTITPFVFPTEDVRSMMTDIERSSGRSFAEDFLRRNLTEFFLFSAWITRRDGDFAHVYDTTLRPTAVIWPSRSDGPAVRRVVEEMTAPRPPMLGLHRRAVMRFGDDARAAVAELWAASGLMSDAASGVDELRAIAADAERAERRQKVRDFPRRLQKVPTRVRAIIAKRVARGR